MYDAKLISVLRLSKVNVMSFEPALAYTAFTMQLWSNMCAASSTSCYWKVSHSYKVICLKAVFFEKKVWAARGQEMDLPKLGEGITRSFLATLEEECGFVSPVCLFKYS